MGNGSNTNYLLLMANITVSISTAKLQFAIAFIEGMKQSTSKATDKVIDEALTTLGYTLVEIYIIRSTPTTEIVEAVFNPPIHHRTGKTRKPKAIAIVTAIEPCDTYETIEEDNVLGV